jgi:hypothetical protein
MQRLGDGVCVCVCWVDRTVAKLRQDLREERDLTARLTRAAEQLRGRVARRERERDEAVVRSQHPHRTSLSEREREREGQSLCMHVWESLTSVDARM